jgi:hypothetical protein
MNIYVTGGCVAVIAFLSSACGGGGSSSGTTTTSAAAEPLTTGIVVNADPSNLPKTINDTVVAIKLAANLIEWGPVGLIENRQKFSPISDWATSSNVTKEGCSTYETINSDSYPNSGDKYKIIDAGCKFTHLSGAQLTYDATVDGEIVAFTNPINIRTENWQYSLNTNLSSSGSFQAIQVGGRYNLDAKYSSKGVLAATASHLSDDTQNDTMIWNVTGSETSTLGSSEVTIRSTYTCSYAAGASTNPDCGNVNTTLTGKIYGVPVTAVMTRISASPVIFQIESGSTKFTIELITYSSNVNKKLFKLTTPTGEVVNLTGEDTNWLRI